MIDEVEMQFFLADFGDDREVERNHGRWSAEFAGDGGEMIAGDSADGAADIDDFGGGEVGGKRGEHTAARHGNLNLAEIQKGMAAEENAVRLHRGDGARGVDGGVALDEDHARHVARNETTVFRARRGGAALRGDEAVVLNLRRELLKRGGLKAGEDQRRFDGRERGAGGESKGGSGSLQGRGIKRKFLCCC